MSFIFGSEEKAFFWQTKWFYAFWQWRHTYTIEPNLRTILKLSHANLTKIDPPPLNQATIAVWILPLSQPVQKLQGSKNIYNGPLIPEGIIFSRTLPDCLLLVKVGLTITPPLG